MTTYTDVASIKVHPGIGIARVGNAQPANTADRSFFYYGPEEPNRTVHPAQGPYKDPAGRILRQAQRFRVYAYRADGTLQGEIVSGDSVNGTVVEIRWTAHLANLKAANYSFQGQYGFNPDWYRNSNISPSAPGTDPSTRTSLVIDPGAKSISGVSQGPVELLGPGSKIFDIPGEHQLSGVLRFDPPHSGTAPDDKVTVTYAAKEVSLGKLYTDEQGRLVVVGAEGAAGSTTTPAVVISKVQKIAGQPASSNPELNGNSYFNNPGWYDDTGGGPIDALLLPRGAEGTPLFDTTSKPEVRGWVCVAPPKYAPTSYNIVSLLDLQLDLFPDQDPYAGEKVNFYRDIYPLLKIITDYAFTSLDAFHGHRPGAQGDFLRGEFLGLLADPSGAGKTAREFVFNFLREATEPTPTVPPPPQRAPSSLETKRPQRGAQMPRLTGNGGSTTENTVNNTNFPNQWLSLTNHQLGKFTQWKDGDFVPGTPGQERWADLPDPHKRDFAALQPTVGGGFHPGIELTYLMQLPNFFEAPFRFAAGTKPGAIAGYMSVPWHGDFWSCNTTFWPAARPDIAVTATGTGDAATLTPRPWFRGNTIPPNADSIPRYNDGYRTMADDWPRYGFIVPKSVPTDQGEQVFHEVERDPALDDQATILATFANDGTSDGQALAVSSGNVTSQALDPASASQKWRLEASSVSPTAFYVVSAFNGFVLGVSGIEVLLQTKRSPHDPAQLWTYLASAQVGTGTSVRGIPGLFYLQSRRSLEVLSVLGGDVATAAHGSTKLVQLFALQSAT